MKRVVLVVAAMATVAALAMLMTFAPVAASPALEPASNGAAPMYVVKPGDTLYRIAARHKVALEQLAAANGITNVNCIRVGQALVIPGTHPAIKISAPAWSSDASSPVDVSGESDTFEGTVLLRVLDSRYRVVGTGRATGGANGTYGPFTASLTYTVSFAQWGLVEAYYASAKDGTEMETVSVRVRLTTATPPTATPVPTVAPTPTGTQRIHVVVPGDNLYRLALRYHTTVDAIAQANHIANVNLIYVGQRLIIP